MEFAKVLSPIKPTVRVMCPGDLVITYERHDSMSYLFLEKGKMYNNKFGSFYHDDFIGQPFGTKISSRSTSGWVYALAANPELWSSALNVRPIVNYLQQCL